MASYNTGYKAFIKIEKSYPKNTPQSYSKNKQSTYHILA